MKAFMKVTFEDGSIFEVPTQVIAQSRATFYLTTRPDTYPTIEDAMRDTVELFADSREIEEWAKNNMDWEDMAPHARLVGYEPKEREWVKAQTALTDTATEIKPPTEGENLLALPLEFALIRISAKRNICSVMPLGDSENPIAMLAFVQGGPNVVDYFMGAMQTLTHQAAEFVAATAANVDAIQGVSGTESQPAQ